MAKFDFAAARKEGYSDEEIAHHLAEKNSNFDVKGALSEGYSPEEINEHLSTLKQPSRAKSLLSAPIKGLIKGAAGLTPFLPRGPISPQAGEKILNQAMPTQEKGAEKFLERAGELVPLAAIGPEGIGLKAAQLGASAGLGHLAEQVGGGKGSQAVAEIAGFTFPGLFKSLGMKVADLFTKKAATSAGQTASKLAQVKPQQVNEGLREAAQRLGVLEDVPASAQISNPKIQSIETKLMQSAAGGPIHEKIERAGGKLAETYQDVAKNLSQRGSMLPSVVSQEASNALKSIEEAATQRYRSLYSQAEKVLPENARTLPNVGNAINKVLDSTLKKLKSSMGTPGKDTLFNRLSRLKENWSKIDGIEAGYIPIKELQELKVDLGQVIKYEVKGGFDKLLTGLQQVAKEGIQSYGRQFNQPYLNRFKEAEKIFGENAKTFRKNPLLKNLLSGQQPEQIFGKMNTVKGINELEKVFNKSVDGKEAFDALKRYKLEDLLNKKVLDKNGEISWGKSAGMFKEPKTRDLVIKLVGPQQYQKLKDLSKVASGIEDGFKRFLNTSKTATTAMDMALFVGLPIKAAQQFFTGNIIGGIKTTAAIFAPRQIAKLIADPEFVEAAIATAKAGKGSKASKFLENAQRVARITAKEMINVSSDQSSEETSP